MNHIEGDHVMEGKHNVLSPMEVRSGLDEYNEESLTENARTYYEGNVRMGERHTDWD